MIMDTAFSSCLSTHCVCSVALRVTGGGEPVIWHGFTLTDMLPFRDVIETIKVENALII